MMLGEGTGLVDGLEGRLDGNDGFWTRWNGRLGRGWWRRCRRKRALQTGLSYHDAICDRFDER